jgi:hypothetical protein
MKRMAWAALLGCALLTAQGAVAQDGPTVTFWRATLQLDAEHLVVKEAFQFDNPAGPLPEPMVFTLTHEIHGEVAVTVRGEDSRSEHVARPDEAVPGRYLVDTPLPAGRSSVTLSYAMHHEEPQVFVARFAYPVENLQLFVQPASIEVRGEGVERAPRSAMPGFATWTIPPLETAGSVELTLTGLSPTASAPAPATTQPRPEERFRVEVRHNRFSEGGTRTLFLIGLVVLLGLGLLYGMGSGEKVTQAQAVRLKRRNDLYRLEDRFVSGQIDREAFLVQRDRLLEQQPGGKSRTGKRQPAGKA